MQRQCSKGLRCYSLTALNFSILQQRVRKRNSWMRLRPNVLGVGTCYWDLQHVCFSPSFLWYKTSHWKIFARFLIRIFSISTLLETGICMRRTWKEGDGGRLNYLLYVFDCLLLLQNKFRFVHGCDRDKKQIYNYIQSVNIDYISRTDCTTRDFVCISFEI